MHKGQIMVMAWPSRTQPWQAHTPVGTATHAPTPHPPFSCSAAIASRDSRSARPVVGHVGAARVKVGAQPKVLRRQGRAWTHGRHPMNQGGWPGHGAWPGCAHVSEPCAGGGQQRRQCQCRGWVVGHRMLVIQVVCVSEQEWDHAQLAGLRCTSSLECQVTEVPPQRKGVRLLHHPKLQGASPSALRSRSVSYHQSARTASCHE